MTIRQAKNALADRLTPYAGRREAEAMASMILEEVKGYTPLELFMHSDRELLEETQERIEKIVHKVISGMPLQYALGKAWFRGRKFNVDASVLIPRQETSQLVDMICDDFKGKPDMSVLDLCTGSGCIAISLALDLTFPQVWAVDISPEALATAQTNSTQLKAHVTYIEGDVFNLESTPAGAHRYDIIVSNPPYILESERQSIDRRVKDYEPALALFVKDQERTAIYEAIAKFAYDHLYDHGKLYLEINPLYAEEIKAALKAAKLNDPQLLYDYKGNLRFAVASK